MDTSFTITQITMHFIAMELKHAFTTSFGTVKQRDMIILELQDETGLQGWGECVAFKEPWYTEETIGTAAHIMRDFLIPSLLGYPLSHPDQVGKLFSHVRGNPMAKAALEGAVWDLYARKQNLSLSHVLGGNRTSIESGISIGLQASDQALFEKIESALKLGYKRVKLKIKPGRDISLIKNVRDFFPDLPIMADANSAYTLADMEHLKELDQYRLMMIEQPLRADDLAEHAILQKEMQTPICLDESIQSCHDAKQAIMLGSCKIINLKIGRVGGFTEAKKILALCEERGIKVWCGGMLESGISRAHNIALASLAQITLPGDISSTDRYWDQDVTTPAVTVENGLIQVPTGTGLGFEINKEALELYTVQKETYSIR